MDLDVDDRGSGTRRRFGVLGTLAVGFLLEKR
jgi:hypothetical protein